MRASVRVCVRASAEVNGDANDSRSKLIKADQGKTALSNLSAVGAFKIIFNVCAAISRFRDYLRSFSDVRPRLLARQSWAIRADAVALSGIFTRPCEFDDRDPGICGNSREQVPKEIRPIRSVAREMERSLALHS